MVFGEWWSMVLGGGWSGVWQWVVGIWKVVVVVGMWCVVVGFGVRDKILIYLGYICYIDCISYVNLVI